MVFRTMDTSDGAKGTVTATLPSSGASLLIRTRDPSGEVCLEGDLVGSGRRVRLPSLERGLYDVRVTADGYRDATTSLDVPPSGSVFYKADFEKQGAHAASKLVQLPPIYQRWSFWTAAGVTAGAATLGTVLIIRALQPEFAPDGDVVVPLP